VDPVVVRGLRAGAIGVAAMSAAGALVLAFGLVTHWTTATAVFEQTGSELGSEFGMFLLTVAYLPNAIVGALAFAMGPGFTMGTFSVTPLHLTITKTPAVPLFAAVPEHQSRTLLGLMIAPLVVGVFLGWACRRIAPRPLGRLRGVAVAAAVVGATAFLLAALTGGRLGGGVFSPVTVPAGLVGAVALGWVLIPAGLVAMLAGPKPARNVRPVPVAGSPSQQPEPELVPEPETEPETDPEASTETGADTEPETDSEDAVADEDLEADELDDVEEDYDDDLDDEPESYEYDPGEVDDEDLADDEDYEELDEDLEETEFEDDIVAELEAEADAELAAEDAAGNKSDEADGDEDHATAQPDHK
jgi:hypothetical protein